MTSMSPSSVPRIYHCWDAALDEDQAVSVEVYSAWGAAREYGDMVYRGPREAAYERTIIVRDPHGNVTRWRMRTEVSVKFMVDPDS